MKLLLTGLLGLWSILGVANGNILFCYLDTWSIYRPGDGKFEPSNIDPFLCTHLGYSFLGTTPNGEIKVLDPWLDMDSGLSGISRTMDLKRINPNLKVLAVVGGWNEGSEKYSIIAADANKRKLFIESVLKFIKEHGFDGLDLDWEYPAQRGGIPQDKFNFVTLLKEIKAAFTPLKLVLCIAVGASRETARTSYDIPNISKHVDFINVMTYDFSGFWDNKAGFNAPLMGQGENNVKFATNFWIQQGAPPSKLNLGLALYGRSFQLSSSTQFRAGSSITGLGAPGPYTREKGFMGYNEICALDETWSFEWDSDSYVPFVHKDNQWIGYDNVESLKLKVKFVKSLGLGGVFVWSLGTDDFRGNCGKKNPLLKAINEAMGYSLSKDNTYKTPLKPSDPDESEQGTGNEEIEEIEKPIENSESKELKPVQPKDVGNCDLDGFFVNANDCSHFYRCANGTRYDFQCSPGLYFDDAIETCNWSDLVNCTQQY